MTMELTIVHTDALQRSNVNANPRDTADHPEGVWDRRRADYRTRCWEFLGGHTTEGAELTIGYTVLGRLEGRRFRRTDHGDLHRSHFVFDPLVRHPARQQAAAWTS